MKRLPPLPQSASKEQFLKVYVRHARPDVKQLIAVANDKYLAWDKARYVKLPSDMQWEEFWLAVKFSRRLQYRDFPLSSGAVAFKYWLPDSCQRILHRIDRQMVGYVGSGDGRTINAADGERYLISSLMDEAISSSMLEGALTTRAAAREMLRQEKVPKTPGERMVLNNYRAMEKARRMRHESLSVEMIHELHSSVTSGDLPPERLGRFQQPGERRVHIEDTEHGEIIHRPPPAEEIQWRMEELVRFANDEAPMPFVHPAIKAIMLHFMMAYIHPYEDGNGRTARALFYWSMLRSGYWLTEYLAVSQTICKSRQQYYMAFRYCEKDESDATYFIHYHLRAVEKALVSFEGYVSRKQAESRNLRLRFEIASQLNERQKALLTHALKNRGTVYSIASHGNSHNISYQTARKDLLALENMGLLTAVSRHPLQFVPMPGMRQRLSDEADKADDEES